MLRKGDESGDSTSEADNTQRLIGKKIINRSSRGRSITNVASYKDNDNSESEEDNDEDIEEDKSVVSFHHNDANVFPCQSHPVDALVIPLDAPDPNRPYLDFAHWYSYGQSYWRERGHHYWDVSENLSKAEIALRNNKSITDDVTTVTMQIRHRDWSNRKAPYHPDLLPSWEEFISTQMYNQSSLKTFRIDEIGLPPSPFLKHKLIPMLTSQPKLYSLELRNCDLEHNDFTAIAGFIQNNTSLSILDLSSNKIESVEVANCLSTAIANHAELSFVNLSMCGLGEAFGQDPIRLKAMLNGCKKLKSLIIDGNLIHGLSLRVVADFLTVTTELTVFSMSNYRSAVSTRWGNNIILGADDSKALSRALKANTSLRQLCLGRNGLSLPSFRSKSVIKNLTHLDLSGNDMRAPGAKVVAQFLSHNRTLTELNLANNQIPSTAASALGAALKRNTTLEHLDLSSNSFTDKCVPAFGKFDLYVRTDD